MRLLPPSFLGRSLVALAVAVVALGVALVVDDDAPTLPRRATPVAAAPVTSEAREVLRDWDAERSAAWAAGDLGALAAAYTPGSLAGRHDVARLRTWTARGWRVEMLRTQVGALRVVRDTRRVLVLLVADRVAGGLAVRAGTTPVVLPRDRWDTRQVVLRRHDGRWRVASVTPVRLGGAATLVG